MFDKGAGRQKSLKRVWHNLSTFPNDATVFKWKSLNLPFGGLNFERKLSAKFKVSSNRPRQVIKKLQNP